MALTGNVHKDLKNPIDATIVTIMAKHNPINTTILPQHKQTGKTGPSPMSFLSPAVNLGAFGCVPASRSWVNMGSVSAARSRSPCDGLEMRKVEQEALRVSHSYPNADHEARISTLATEYLLTKCINRGFWQS